MVRPERGGRNRLERPGMEAEQAGVDREQEVSRLLSLSLSLP